MASNNQLLLWAREVLQQNWQSAIAVGLLSFLQILIPVFTFYYRPFPYLTFAPGTLFLAPVLDAVCAIFFLQILRSGRTNLRNILTTLPAYWKLFILCLLFWIFNEAVRISVFFLELPFQAPNWNYTGHFSVASILFRYRDPVLLLPPNGYPARLIALLYPMGNCLLFLCFFPRMYLLIDNPRLSPIQALKQSPAFMNGCKWKLFHLAVKYAAWVILCYLIYSVRWMPQMPAYKWLGILFALMAGGIFLCVTLLYGTAFAAFYDDIKMRAAPNDPA